MYVGIVFTRQLFQEKAVTGKAVKLITSSRVDRTVVIPNQDHNDFVFCQFWLNWDSLILPKFPHSIPDSRDVFLALFETVSLKQMDFIIFSFIFPLRRCPTGQYIFHATCLAILLRARCTKNCKCKQFISQFLFLSQALQKVEFSWSSLLLRQRFHRLFQRCAVSTSFPGSFLAQCYTTPCNLSRNALLT